MSLIVEPKTYSGKELESIFFRPMLSGPDARELGIKVLYNMPVPTVLNFWRRASDILQKFDSAGWTGGEGSEKYQKTIELHKVKAEMGYAASDYFSMVFEQITNGSDINLDDLSGTALEEAETRLFKEAIAESIRATLWLGSTTRTSGLFSTFDGFLKKMVDEFDDDEPQITFASITSTDYNAENAGETILKRAWDNASDILKEFKSQGNLVYFVTSEIYAKYEDSLDSATLEGAYQAKQQGRESLSYRGIPVVDVQLSNYLAQAGDLPQNFALLTDRRNLALAVNTADFPGTEVRMWYNPDEMQNRQRAVFMAGCDYLLPELVSLIVKS
ncbi:MAG: hypothetical protein LBM63_03005 [Rikenellaceae bacterium]|jgi:hypothetical protein|nr:hypothetical protein [Rikenellaceae bacterium]